MNAKNSGFGLSPQRWLALVVMLGGTFLPLVDYFVINMILPIIRSGFNASTGQLQLVLSSFTGIYAVFLITGARLGDIFGRKRMFLIGILGFGLSSLFSACAPSVGVLILGRAFMGFFSAVLAPQVLASINVMFSSAERGKAIGFMGTTYGLGAVVGMVLGGVLMAWRLFGLTWQTVFLFYAVVCLFVFIGASLFMEESRVGHAPRLDFGGVGLLFVALASLVFPLIEGRGLGWPLWILIVLAISPFALATFLWFEAKKTRLGRSPLVDLTLFADRPFVVGLIIALTSYSAFAFLFCFSIYLQAGRHVSALGTGLIVFPLALTFFLSSFLSPYLLKFLKARILVVAFGFLTLGLLGLCFAVQGASDWGVEASLAVAGVGNGLMLSSLIKVVTSELEPKHAGLAAGALLSAMQIGAVLGYVLIGGLFFLTLGPHPNSQDYTRAFSVAVLCSVVLMTADGFLALQLVARREKKVIMPLGAGELD